MSTYDLRKKLIDIAAREVGVREINNSNTGRRVREYQAATDLSKSIPTGWAWCAAFVSWVIREWLKDPAVIKALGLAKERVEKWRPKTAAAFGFEEWANDHDKTVFTPRSGKTLHTGDIVVFNISHVGLVVTDDNDYIYTIEGNTNSQGGRDGGGVYKKIRKRSEVKHFIRILE